VFTAENQLILIGGDRHDWWWNPGGGIEENESPEAALTRELQEELNLTPSTYTAQFMGSFTWTFIKDATQEEIEQTTHYFVVKLHSGTQLNPGEEITRFLRTNAAAVVGGEVVVPESYAHIFGVLQEAEQLAADLK